ncbi:MAG TPA: hypothetical protein VGN42_22945 [Pirellulales bacterium]|jgi:hypothetical protein|nr:hypothetical protein [Pirellulales bacterium]
MWNAAGKSVELDRFQPFEPREVLYEFDGPRIFTVKDAEDELNLACWSDENQQICRYVVVPTTSKILAALRGGEISVYDALNQPRCWLCDVTHQGDLASCQRVEFEALPKDSLPAPGAMLLPALEPQPVDLEGRIRELDKDQLSFELREIEKTAQVQRFVFDEGLLGEILRAFQDDVRVKVAGRTVPVKNLAYAVAISRLAGNESPPLAAGPN